MMIKVKKAYNQQCNSCMCKAKIVVCFAISEHMCNDIALCKECEMELVNELYDKEKFKKSEE